MFFWTGDLPPYWLLSSVSLTGSVTFNALLDASPSHEVSPHVTV